MWRWRPSAGWRTPERSSSSGVPKAPPALITALARTCQSRPAAACPVARYLLHAGGRHPRPAAEPGRPVALGEHPLHLDARPNPGARGHGARQVGDVRGPLRVDAATDRAGAALDAAARVAADRPAARAQRRRALDAELPVSAQRLDVERGDGENLLGRVIVGVELRGPVDALAIPPLLEHLPWCAEAGAGVDHGGAAQVRPTEPGSRACPRRWSCRRRGRGAGSPRADPG